MKYSKKTLEEMKRIIDRVARVSQQISGSVEIQNHLDARGRNNSLTPEQRKAATDLKDQMGKFAKLGLNAQRTSENIQKLLDGNVQNTRQLDDQIYDFIEAMKNNAGQFLPAIDQYFLWDDHDKTPGFSDPAWPLYNLTKEFDDACKNLETLQLADGIHKNKELNEQFDEEMTYLSAMSCDGIDLAEMPVLLQNAKNEADEAKNRLETLKSEEEKRNWQQEYTNATQRISQIPNEIKNLEDRRKVLDNTLKDAERDLQDVKKKHKEYDDTRKEIEEAERRADSLAKDIEAYQKELDSLTKKTAASAEFYNQQMSAYEKRGGARALDFLKPYVEDRTRALKWQKVQELAGELSQIISEDSTKLKLFAAEIAKYSRRLSEGKLPENGQQRRDMPDQETQARLDRIGGIVAQMMRIAPDKSLLDDLLVPKEPVNDAGQYVDNLTSNLQVLIEGSEKNITDNVLFQNTQKKKEEISKTVQEYEQNARKQQNGNFLNKKEKKAIEKTNKNLSKEIIKQNKDIAVDAVNTDELDAVIRFQIDYLAEQAAADAKMDVLKEKQKDSLKHAENLGKKLNSIRSETELSYLTYQLGKKDEAPQGQDKYFENLENTISRSAEQDRNRRDNEIPQEIERLKTSLQEQKAKAHDYDLGAYKTELVRIQAISERKDREYQKLLAISKHLKTARDLYNTRVDEMAKASSSLTKEKQRILDGIDAFLRDFDKNKKADHENSDEYKAIKTALEEFKKDNAQEITPAKFKDMLSTLKQRTTAYKEKKNKQWFHWRPTGQRKFRLDQADNIERFCDEHTALIDSMGLDEKTLAEIKHFDDTQPGRLSPEEMNTVMQERKTLYEDKISTFHTIVLETKNIKDRTLNGEAKVTDEARKNFVIDALVNNEVEKKLYQYDPEKVSLGKHVLDIKQFRSEARANIEKKGSKIISTMMELSKDNPTWKAGDIAFVREQVDALKQYDNFKSYDQNLREVVKNGDDQMNRGANQEAMNNNRAMVPQ